MSWHCSLALEEEFWVDDCLGGEQCAQLRSIRIAERSSFEDKKIKPSGLSPSGTTLEPSMVDHGVERWMSSLGASRARTSAPPEKVRGSRGNDPGFGRRWQGLSVRLDRVLSLWRIRRFSGFVVLPWSSKTWPFWGTIRNGVVYRRRTAERPIKGTGSGYLPTPTAKANMMAPSMQKWLRHRNLFPTPSACSYGTNKGRAAGRTGKERPSLQTMAKKNLWPTPTARDWRSGKASPTTMSRNSRPLSERVGGQLNPMWVEWLMGWPVGWTDLKPLGMDRFHEWLQQHGK